MKKVLIIVTLIFAVISSDAKVTLSCIFQDNMVLQQNANVAIWGKATPGKNVQITASWTNEKFSVLTDKDGKWITRIPTPTAGGPYTLSFKEGETVTLSNVLIGEVWLCSGQSNMEMPMSGYNCQPAEFATDRIINAKPTKQIRICNVSKFCSNFRQDSVKCKWCENNPETVSGTSATAYYFAETLQNALDIPVGIIVSCWGGTTIEAWMTKEVIEKVAPGEFNFDYLNNKEEKHFGGKAQTMYNGQIAPLEPFTINGIIWYQGESNRGRHEQYARLQPAYVQMMRDNFQSPNAGFYFVQIAPYPYDNPDKFTSGYFYEAQASTLKTIPHSGMATTVDIGEYQTIHPHKKLEVGKRLAYLTLTKDYGFKGITAEAPQYKSMTIEGNQVKVTFDCDHNGINPIADEIHGFEVAGEDKVFHRAKAHRSKDSEVTVSSDEVKNPVAVRYCFRNFEEGNLYNNYGIPVGPFRTDNWNID